MDADVIRPPATTTCAWISPCRHVPHPRYVPSLCALCGVGGAAGTIGVCCRSAAAVVVAAATGAGAASAGAVAAGLCAAGVSATEADAAIGAEDDCAALLAAIDGVDAGVATRSGAD